MTATADTPEVTKPAAPEQQGFSSRARYDRFRVLLREKKVDLEGDRKKKDDDKPKLSKQEKRQKRWKNLRLYRDVVWPFRWSIAGMFGLSLIAAAMDMISPWTFGWVIDHILGPNATVPAGERRSLLIFICVGLAALLLLARLVDVFRFYKTQALNSKMIIRLRSDLHRRLLRLGLGDIQNLKTGKIVSRLSGDVDQAMGLLQQGVMSPGIALVRIVMTLGILFQLNWRLAIAATMILPPVVLLSFMWIVKVRPIFKSAGQDKNETDARITETFAGIRVVRTFRREARELRDSTVGNHTMIRKRLLAIRRAMIVDVFWELVIPMVTVAILLIGGLLLLAGFATTVGEIVTFNMYAGMLMWPIARIVFSLNQTQQSLAAVERVFEIYDLPVDKEDADDAVPAPQDVRELRFDAMTFAYTEGKPVIQDLSLTVPGGSVVALVGPSGAGKSTLCDLIARFHDPTEGAILLNGIDLRAMQLDSYRRKIAIVQQDTFLFDGTVRDNIAYGRRSAPIDEVELAATRANAHSFITELDKGYDTIIGERGVKLSGGQRQRLSIARALLADPQILILDEATSNLDTESEQLIQSALQELYANRATFVIAHRLSTVTHADLIVVIDQGRLVEAGTHEQLLASGGMYSEMVHRQSEAFGEESVGLEA